MTATPSRIGFILEATRDVSAASATIAARYGNSARRDEEPIATGLDTRANAQTIADDRLVLLGVARRLFTVTCALKDAISLSHGGSVQFIDPQKGFDGPALIAGITHNFNEQRTTLELWG